MNVRILRWRLLSAEEKRKILSRSEQDISSAIAHLLFGICSELSYRPRIRDAIVSFC